MRIAVVGAGAIGGYLGAKLALAGEEVTFIARNRNLAAINANGFRLILEDGSEHHAVTARAVQHMADAGEQDAVLLTVKAHQVRDVLPYLRALFGPKTMVVTMINGLPWWYFHRLAGPFEGRQLDSVDPGGTIAAHIEPGDVILCGTSLGVLPMKPGTVVEVVIDGIGTLQNTFAPEASPDSRPI
jgi:2-dehydropantoate 2-reductase